MLDNYDAMFDLNHDGKLDFNERAYQFDYEQGLINAASGSGSSGSTGYDPDCDCDSDDCGLDFDCDCGCDCGDF